MTSLSRNIEVIVALVILLLSIFINMMNGVDAEASDDWYQFKEFRNHSNYATTVDWSPDGKFIASGGDDNKVVVIDCNSWANIKWLKLDKTLAKYVCFSPDSTMLAVGDHQGFLFVYDTENWDEIVSFDAHNGWLESMDWSPDGKYLATGGGYASGYGDKHVKVWYTDNWTMVAEMGGFIDCVRTIDWHPSGDYIAAGSEDSAIKIWYTSNWTRYQYLTKHESSVTFIEWSPDGKLFASASDTNEGAIKIFETETWTKIKTIDEGVDEIYNIRWSPDGKWLVSASHFNSMRILDTSSWKVVIRVENTHTTMSVDWHPDGSMLVTGCYDGDVKVWQQYGNLDPSDFERDLEEKEIIYGDSTVWIDNSGTEYYEYHALGFDPSGRFLISGSLDHPKLEVWDTVTFSLVKTIYMSDYFGSSIPDVEWSPSGHFFGASGSGIQIFDSSNFEIVKTFSGSVFSWSPDEKTLVTGDGKIVEIWDFEQEKLKHKWTIDESRSAFGIAEISWSPNGKYIAVTKDSDATIYNVDEKKVHKELRGIGGSCMSVSWSPDMEHLALGLPHRFRIYNTVSWEVEKDVSGLSDFTSSTAWSPSGRYFICASDDTVVDVWDSNGWKVVDELDTETDDVASVAWSPDGECIAFGCDKKIILFKTELKDVGSSVDNFELWETDKDDDGVPDFIDAYPSDGSKWDDIGTGADSTYSLATLLIILISIIVVIAMAIIILKKRKKGKISRTNQPVQTQPMRTQPIQTQRREQYPPVQMSSVDHSQILLEINRGSMMIESGRVEEGVVILQNIITKHPEYKMRIVPMIREAMDNVKK